MPSTLEAFTFAWNRAEHVDMMETRCYQVLTAPRGGWRDRAAMGWTGLMTPSEEKLMRPRRIALRHAVVAAVTALAFTACGTTTAPQAPQGATTAPSVIASSSTLGPGNSPTPPSDAAAPAGAYLSRAEYTEQAAARTGTKVVYFFHAPWCPTCRATEDAIARDGIPAGLTLVKVDFDTENDLRKKYGVTTQHTFVQVDASGAELAKWTGSKGGAEILAKTV